MIQRLLRHCREVDARDVSDGRSGHLVAEGQESHLHADARSTRAVCRTRRRTADEAGRRPARTSCLTEQQKPTPGLFRGLSAALNCGLKVRFLRGSPSDFIPRFAISAIAAAVCASLTHPTDPVLSLLCHGAVNVARQRSRTDTNTSRSVDAVNESAARFATNHRPGVTAPPVLSSRPAWNSSLPRAARTAGIGCGHVRRLLRQQLAPQSVGTGRR